MESLAKGGILFARDIVLGRVAECFGIPVMAVQVALFAMDFFFSV